MILVKVDGTEHNHGTPKFLTAILELENYVKLTRSFLLWKTSGLAFVKFTQLTRVQHENGYRGEEI